MSRSAPKKGVYKIRLSGGPSTAETITATVLRVLATDVEIQYAGDAYPSLVPLKWFNEHAWR